MNKDLGEREDLKEQFIDAVGVLHVEEGDAVILRLAPNRFSIREKEMIARHTRDWMKQAGFENVPFLIISQDVEVSVLKKGESLKDPPEAVTKIDLDNPNGL